MKPFKMACICTDELGWGTYTNHVREALKCIPEVEVLFLTAGVVSQKDVAKVSLWKRLYPPFKTAHFTYAKIVNELPDDLNCLFLFSFEMAFAFKPLLVKYPAIVTLDGTMSNRYDLKLNQQLSWLERIMVHGKKSLANFLIRKTATKVQHYLAWTSWAQKSLIEDYGIEPEKITIASGGYLKDDWKKQPKTTSGNSLKNLLFVGNDFERKGGEFLLSLFAKHLYPKMSLTIVSNDPKLTHRKLPAGVTLVRGITDYKKLQSYYAQADLFLFPTNLEWMGQVLIEASLMGVPSITHDVGGIRDIIIDGETGFTLPLGSSEEEWLSAINTLVSDKELYTTMCKNAKEHASSLSTQAYFLKQLRVCLRAVGCPTKD